MAIAPAGVTNWPQIGQAAVAVLALALPALAARRGWIGGSARLPVRLFASASYFTGAFAVMTIVAEMLAGAALEWLLLPVLLLVLIPSLLMILLIEGAARLGRPRRSRRWLFLSAALFMALFTLVPGLAALSLVGPGVRSLLGWDLLGYFALVLGAAILWWSHLPPADPAFARIFE
jgi:hypothetical protein